MTKFAAFSVSLFAFLLVTVALLQKTKVNNLHTACMPQNFAGNYDSSKNLALYQGYNIKIPKLSDFAQNKEDTQVLADVSPSEKWIEISLSDQKLRAWNGQNLYLEEKISTGGANSPTPKGEFHIWSKLAYSEIKGGIGSGSYDLPNVPFAMFFEGGGIPSWKGYAINGSYWLKEFGLAQGNGCVNIPVSVAQKLFYWANPSLSQGQTFVRASVDNPGTRVIIRD
ncbi:MAG: L,D-transpeptidase [Candidatus Woesebacteria bacterium]|nr:MAG: L,D-transpeptidase [Candidatus Woesebacteria bacterium]